VRPQLERDRLSSAGCRKLRPYAALPSPLAVRGETLNPAREIACPANPTAPLHFARYDAATESLACPECGRLTAAEVSARLAEELARFEGEFPGLRPGAPLAEDEHNAQAVAGRLFRAFPSDLPFAVELFLAWGQRALGGRLPEDHLALCAERALDRETA
jgi:hypothetical protein